jgi:hypothetical protein
MYFKRSMRAVSAILVRRILDFSVSYCRFNYKRAILMVLTSLVLIVSNPSFTYGQNQSLSPFLSLDDRSLTNSLSIQNSSQGHMNFQPVFQASRLNSSDSSMMSSSAASQNETQRQETSLGSFAQHPREPLTQYQTVVQTPARTLTVQPTTTLPQATVYPPGITVPSTAGLGGTTVFPQTTAGLGGTTVFPQTTAAGTGTLPPSAVTFPPSVFPPTTSFVPPTSIAPVVGPLSPWFPSIPAIACGGTFSFSVIGSLDRDNDDGNHDNNDNNNNKNRNGNNDNDKDKLYAIQIQSNGGSALDTDSIEGKVFAGEKNIERNNGEDFDIKDVFNDCQVVTYSN